MEIDKKYEIIEQAYKRFMEEGIRSVTMDSLASDLSMSKRTLYENFINKEELVFEVVNLHIQNELKTTKEIIENYPKPLSQLLKIGKHAMEVFSEMKIVLATELAKFYPEAWKLVENFLCDFVFGVMRENIENGIKTGIFRKETDAILMSRLYVNSIEKIFTDDLQLPNNYELRNIFKPYFTHFLRGMMSENQIHKIDNLTTLI